MNPILRKHLSRRTILRGLGAAVALPFLDSMTPAFAGPSPAKALRLAFTAVPNGISMVDWTPVGSGAGFAFSPILKALEPHRDDLLVLSGLAHPNANDLGDGPGDHARAGACFLTGVHPKKTAGADIHSGISADQIAAAALSKETRLASLELGCEDARTVGNCDSGYSCAYTNSIAWRSPTTPLPPEVNPRSVFERLFGADDVPLDPETRARRARQRKSVLDIVSDRSKALLGVVGPADRRKVDEYLYAIREIERQIQRAEQDGREILPSIEKPAGIPTSFAEHVKLMFDLQAVAFQADITRVSTMMIGREGSLQTYPEIGVPDAHHPLTHHRNIPELVAKVVKVNTHHVDLFSHLIAKLKETPDGDGTLLDHTMVVYGSAISDGNKHTHEDLPVLVAGGRGAGLSLGRHAVHPKGTPMTNLYLALLARAGVKPESIGDSNGELNLVSV